jgi:hypothetical protein
MRLSALLGLFVCLFIGTPLQAAPPIDFNRDIRPILSNKCLFCHGPDEKERKGGVDGLRFDILEGATADLGTGEKAVVAGDPEKSALIARITTSDPDLRMPPAATGKKLSEQEVALLREWIRQGARYAKHWSYETPVRQAVPAVKDTAWARNDIDRFILARLEAEGLKPSPEADRTALIRRASLDLTGLPPTLAEVDAFLQDNSTDAYEKVIDRLLAKDAYGEHWARNWLDLGRYADSAGYADDPSRTIWAYRDYVIRAFNQNMPFDQFTVEQIAGDLLPSPTPDQIIATAFHRNTLTNSEGGTIDEEFRNVAVVDRVNTTMAVWMGTTIACAQCHTHKFDPLTQEEFFKLFAIFNSTEDNDRRDESPLFEIWTPSQLQQKEAWKNEIAALQQTLNTPTSSLAAAQQEWERTLPTDLNWKPLVPSEVVASSGLPATIQPDGLIRFEKGAVQDSYRLVLPLGEVTDVNAVRLETVSDKDLPGQGAGFGGGNFVVTGVTGQIESPRTRNKTLGRYVRIEIPGTQKMLSLAEVEVLSGDRNLALKGAASQSSTDFNGPANLAVDGNTNGDYGKGSVTHTAISDNPWWEIDLAAEQPIDRLMIWNRTQGLEGRLADFRVSVLDAQRKTVWERTIADPPKPSREVAVSGGRGLGFSAAFADHSQPGFPAVAVLEESPDPAARGKRRKKTDANIGWAVGGAIAQPHELILIPETSYNLPEGMEIVLTIDQKSPHPNHVLGRFRISVSSDEHAANLAEVPSSMLEILRLARELRSVDQSKTLEVFYRSIAPELDEHRAKLAVLQKQLAEIKPETTVPVMKEMAGAAKRKTRLQHRGNYLDLGQEVGPGVPAVFSKLPEGGIQDRLTLARWLIDEANPLTARVLVNRYWEEIFGVGIVRTSEEFGSQGELPSHPELLDWLATEVVREKWNLKQLLRLIVTSSAYRQSSKVTPEMYESDPENRLLARGPRFRLSAETIRDQALALSGLLSPKMYGMPARPPQPSMGLSAAFGSGIDWQTSTGEDKFRRGIYTTWRRSNPYPSMTTFDAPNRETCTIRRGRTNTPLQALVTLNDPVYIEAAQALARRMATHGATPQEQIAYGFRICTSRDPLPVELDRLVAFYEQSRAEFEKSPEEARKVAVEPLGPLPEGLTAPNLAAGTVTANILLNLDEVLMKR